MLVFVCYFVLNHIRVHLDVIGLSFVLIFVSFLCLIGDLGLIRVEFRRGSLYTVWEYKGKEGVLLSKPSKQIASYIMQIASYMITSA